MQIDAIEQRPAQARLVAGDGLGRAAAGSCRMAAPAAGAGVHRRHQLEARRVSRLPRRARVNPGDEFRVGHGQYQTIGRLIVVSKMKKYIKDKRNEIKTELKQAIGEEMAEIFKIGSVKCNESYHFESCSIFPENEQLKIHIDEKLVQIVNY